VQTFQESTSSYNANLAQLAQADAQIATNMADLARATWTLNQKTVPAPVDGIVFQKYYRLGEYSEAGKPILSILAPEDIKVIFYVREPMLAKINLNDAVSVRCDECKKSYTAHVSFISPRAEYTPPVIFSDQTNAKLIYRIEARFAMDDAYKMHPGQPMMVELKKHA
jgi:HlyD family secretion protein